MTTETQIRLPIAVPESLQKCWLFSVVSIVAFAGTVNGQSEHGQSDPTAAKAPTHTVAQSEADYPEVDCQTLSEKVMVGYQGWFNCEGDGMEYGWGHWAKNRKRPFGPGNVTVDLWPDVGELSPEERYATQFRHADGRAAEVFSSANQETVDRHFRWMKEYGIDGAFLQRFANGLSNPALKLHKDTVLSHVRRGAKRHGRAYAVMYDLSGLRSGQLQRVCEDWENLNDEMNVTTDPNYLHHQGKPLVAVWGVGFSDGRPYSLDECVSVVDFLKQRGCAVMLGIPTFWREGRRDAIDSAALKELLARADVISPWTVGRYRTPKQAQTHADAVWREDLKWCQSKGVDFLPVVYPGFSWNNLNGDKASQIPRRGGHFLWSQATAAKKVGCNMIYVAMFDEVDEGTAIFKCTNDPPVGEDVRFITYEGLPNDHYLKLTGKIGEMLRNEIGVEPPAFIPKIQPSAAD